MQKVKNNENKPSIEMAMELLNGKWKLNIIWHLQDASKRNNELLKAMPNISQKILTQNLRELEEANIIERVVFPVIPPKVEYSLTKTGKKLKPILMMLEQWAEDYMEEK